MQGRSGLDGPYGSLPARNSLCSCGTGVMSPEDRACRSARGQGPSGDRACPSAWHGGEASGEASGPGKPQAPCLGWGTEPLSCWCWLAGYTAVPPWLSVVSGNQKPEDGQWGSPSASCIASSLQFMDSLEICKTLCQHQSVCVNPFIWAPQPASLFGPLEAEMGSARLCTASLCSCPTSSQSLNT